MLERRQVMARAATSPQISQIKDQSNWSNEDWSNTDLVKYRCEMRVGVGRLGQRRFTVARLLTQPSSSSLLLSSLELSDTQV